MADKKKNFLMGMSRPGAAPSADEKPKAKDESDSSPKRERGLLGMRMAKRGGGKC